MPEVNNKAIKTTCQEHLPLGCFSPLFCTSRSFCAHQLFEIQRNKVSITWISSEAGKRQHSYGELQFNQQWGANRIKTMNECRKQHQKQWGCLVKAAKHNIHMSFHAESTHLSANERQSHWPGEALKSTPNEQWPTPLVYKETS